MDLIVGAGITGLSYAAATSNDYLVIEKEPEIGGYCRTILQDGFIWDYSGHFFHFRNKDIERFVMDKMHKDRDIITLKKMTQIRYKNKHIDYPFQKNIHQLDKEPNLSIACMTYLSTNIVKERHSKVCCMQNSANPLLKFSSSPTTKSYMLAILTNSIRMPWDASSLMQTNKKLLQISNMPRRTRITQLSNIRKEVLLNTLIQFSKE